MNDERIIARIARSATEEIVVRRAETWNIQILDLRWYKNGNPTHKGIRCNMDEAKTLLKAVRKAVNENVSVEKTTEDENEGKA
jgi:hypothetical protein